MSPPASELWRVFPWNREAADGEPFSPPWVPPSQGQGRFDLPGTPGGVIYLSETPEHAVAEMIQHYRGQRLDDHDLRIAGHPLALVPVRVPPPILEKVVDLCEPAELVRLGLRPDETASSSRRTTQSIAAMIHSSGHAGLRWWSALSGDWHTVVLFRERAADRLVFGEPEVLGVSHGVVRGAMRALGISGGAGRVRR